MGLFSKKIGEGTHDGPKMKSTVDKNKWGDNPYGVVGQDHVPHVQKKLDVSGFAADYEIVLPKDNELQIDYDCEDLPEQFKEVLNILTQAYCDWNQAVQYTVSRSMSGNLHVIISLPGGKTFSAAERVAWQACFGSDFKREALSMLSVVRGVLNPTLLIEKKGGSEIVATEFVVRTRPPEPQGRKFR